MRVPLPDPTKTFAQQELLVLLSMLLFGEGRSVNEVAKLGIGSVIRNRMVANRWYMGGKTWAGVMLQPGQFDCFAPQDVNARKVLRPLDHERYEVWEACYRAAEKVMASTVDTTSGALFYFTKPRLVAPKAWGPVEVTCKIDGVTFCRELPKVQTRVA